MTSTGAHGANRLASNSLLEAVVFAGRIAEDIQGLLPAPKCDNWASPADESDDIVTESDSPELQLLRRTMSNCAGVIRDQAGLTTAARIIADLQSKNRKARFGNMLTTAKFVVAGALQREESRGGHFRSDRQGPVSHWERRTYLTLPQADDIIRDAAEAIAA